MIFRLLTFVTLIFSIAGCNSTNWEEDYSNSAALTFNLVNVCVDRTLNAHAELNTANYVLDLQDVSGLNKEGIDSFLKMKSPLLSATHEDSALVIKNKSWSKSRLLQNMIVKFIEIEYIDHKYVSVRLSKMRARNQTIKVTLDLERQNDTYKIIKSEIRR